MAKEDPTSLPMKDGLLNENGKKLDSSGKFSTTPIQYYIDSNPPWHLCIILGFQHYLTMLGGTIAIPLLLSPALCIGGNMVATGELIATMLFVSGIGTLVQSTFGTRLPIIQGGTATFAIPALAILSMDQWKCPSLNYPIHSFNDSSQNFSAVSSDPLNKSTRLSAYDSTDSTIEIWQIRMREIQGAIILASLVEVVIGLSGLVGLMMKFVGPVSMTPFIILIGLSLFRVASAFCETNMAIAFLTMVLVILFSQYLRDVHVPWLAVNGGKCQRTTFPVFRLFPVVLGVIVSWLVCLLLTVTNAVPDDVNHWAYETRTDVRAAVLRDSSWFRIPYPSPYGSLVSVHKEDVVEAKLEYKGAGEVDKVWNAVQWGIPTFSVASVLGMIPGVLAGLIESIGDYYACARLSGAPVPGVNVINRGIFVEGVLCVLAGTFGTGTGLTSYSENVGAIGLTKVSSRRVIQTGAILMLLFGVLGKFGALFVTLPRPVVGGLFVVMFGMVIAVGLSNMQFISLLSTRNLFIIGFSTVVGMVIPEWLDKHAGAISTGIVLIDQIVTVLGRTSVFVGGVTALLLDNTAPGTDDERGLIKWQSNFFDATTEKVEYSEEKSDIIKPPLTSTYDLPCGMTALRRWTWTKYVPISPTFKGFKTSRACKRNKDNEMI